MAFPDLHFLHHCQSSIVRVFHTNLNKKSFDLKVIAQKSRNGTAMPACRMPHVLPPR
jgi:hypothetical protein